MKRAIVLLAVILIGLAAPAHAGDTLSADDLSLDKFRLAPNVGTLGVGIEGSYRWNEHWGARAGINGGAVNFTYHDNNSDLVNKTMLLNAGLTADYYPFADGFRVSGGVRFSANKIDGELRNLRKHGKNFSIVIADPLTDYTVRQNAIQPYLGAGYSVQLKDRVSLNFDLGALYAGSPDLSVTSRADQLACGCITRHQIEKQIERQRDRIAPFQVLPVVQIGLNIRF